MSDEAPIVHPPSSFTTDMDDRKPLLWLPDGRALVRKIGFDTRGGNVTKVGPPER